MRIGIYPRKSVYRDNSDSVEVQVKMGKEYAQIVYRGEDIEFFVYDKDEGFSGKNTDRPSFQELMSDVKANKLDVVIVYKLDRISRNVKEFSEMYETMQKHNVAFVSVKESFDTSTPIGRTVMYILAAFSQLERENTSERVGDNMRQLGLSGKWTGGKLPAGMSSIRKKVDGKEHSYLIVDKNNIEKVKLLYDLMLNGYSITGVERYCRDHDITSQSGKFLGSSQIHGILTNPVYCQNDLQAYYYLKEKGCTLVDKHYFDGKKGLIGYGRTRGTEDKMKLGMDMWTIAVGIHDYVMPADKWIAVQQRLGQNKHVRTLKHEAGILRGVLRCRCGGSMQIRTYIQHNKSYDTSFSYYYCENHHRKGEKYCDAGYTKIEIIDNMFLEKLKSLRIDEDFIHPKDTNKGLSDVRILKKDIKTTETALSNLTIQLQENVASTAAKYIVAQIEKLDQKLSTLNNQLQYEEIRMDKSLTEQEERKELYKNICFLLDNFDTLTYKEKNELIRCTVKSCVLDDCNLHISF
jgi:DNA invertase Pin-like site-specific DNA recombinase